MIVAQGVAVRLTSLLLLVALVGSASACGDEPHLTPVTSGPGVGGRAMLQAAGRTLSVELAVTREQITRGLMERTHLAPDAGMLFVFTTSKARLFWMKNTRIPLDIIFLEADGTVINVAGAAPLVERPGFPSERPARFVLEMARGWATGAGLRPGDRVEIPAEVAALAVEE